MSLEKDSWIKQEEFLVSTVVQVSPLSVKTVEKKKIMHSSSHEFVQMEHKLLKYDSNIQIRMIIAHIQHFAAYSTHNNTRDIFYCPLLAGKVFSAVEVCFLFEGRGVDGGIGLVERVHGVLWAKNIS